MEVGIMTLGAQCALPCALFFPYRETKTNDNTKKKLGTVHLNCILHRTEVTKNHSVIKDYPF